MGSEIATLIVLLVIGVVLKSAYERRKIDMSAVIMTAIIGFFCLYIGGIKWVIPLLAFFIIGSAATKYKKQMKDDFDGGQKIRTWKNVFANGGATGIFAVCYVLTNNNIFFVGMIVSVAVAMADTLATEMGEIFGQHPRSIWTLKKVNRGTAGAVTIQGFIFALIGSAIISAFLFLCGHSTQVFLICWIFGFLGCVADSLLGSTLEQKGYINTHQINFVTTLFIGGIGTMITILLLGF